MGNIQLQSLKIGFNNAGKNMFYELTSLNHDILNGLKEFLIDLNSNGIVLEQKTFSRLLKDIHCSAFEGDANDPTFQKTLIEKTLPKKSLEKAVEQFQTTLEQNNISLSEKTTKLLNHELGITRKTHISSIEQSQQQNDL